MEEVYIKENNGGGLQIEYYQGDEIVAVVTDIEYQLESQTKTEPYDDLIGLITGKWSYSDAGNWYDNEGNSHEKKNDDGTEITAADVIDNHWSTHIIAFASADDGEVERIEIYPDKMGNNGKRYFHID